MNFLRFFLKENLEAEFFNISGSSSMFLPPYTEFLFPYLVNSLLTCSLLHNVYCFVQLVLYYPCANYTGAFMI